MSEIKPENLTLFAKEGRLEEVKSVLALPNCNVNAVNERQQSALVLAAKGGFTEIVLELLNAKVRRFDLLLVFISRPGHSSEPQPEWIDRATWYVD